MTLGTSFLSVLDEGVDGGFLFAVFAFGGVVERVLEVDALAAEHDRADGDLLLFLVEVGDDEGGLVGADSAGLVVTGEELDHVAAGEEGEAGVVLDGAVGEFGGGGAGELDVDVVGRW